jgi:hypothetical protein
MASRILFGPRMDIQKSITKAGLPPASKVIKSSMKPEIGYLASFCLEHTADMAPREDKLTTPRPAL